MARLRVLMPVFNEIDFDGRVERCATAVGCDHDVTVLALDSGRPYVPSGFAVVRIAVPGLGRLRAVRPFLFWLGFLVEALRRRPDLIHAHDYFMAFPGWLAARLLGVRLVYDAHELSIPTPGRAMRLSERVYLALERWMVGRAAAVIAASAARARLMQDYYRLPDAPTVIRNIPAPPPPPDLDAIRARYPVLADRPDGLFRLVYQGYMPPQFGLDRFVAAVAALGEGWQLVLAGLGPALPALERQIAETCPPGRVIVLGRVPRQDLPGILRLCDAGIIAYGRELLNEIHCAPNKVHEYAQAGLPVVANANPGLREIIEPWRIGVCGEEPGPAIAAVRRDYQAFRAAVATFAAQDRWDGEEAKLRTLYRRLTQPLPREPQPV